MFFGFVDFWMMITDWFVVFWIFFKILASLTIMIWPSTHPFNINTYFTKHMFILQFKGPFNWIWMLRYNCVFFSDLHVNHICKDKNSRWPKCPLGTTIQLQEVLRGYTKLTRSETCQPEGQCITIERGNYLDYAKLACNKREECENFDLQWTASLDCNLTSGEHCHKLAKNASYISIKYQCFRNRGHSLFVMLLYVRQTPF